MRPTHDELKSIWLHSYSRSSLLEAQQWIDTMARINPKAPEMRALVCATVISYARPFTISQVTAKERVVPLAGVAPPQELAAAHEMVLKLRNKVMGHKDAIPAKGDAVSPNIVLLRRDATGFDLHTVIIEGMTDKNQDEVRKLCQHFTAYCESKIRPIIDHYGDEVMKYPPGMYELVVCDAPDPWVRAFAPKAAEAK